jgi:hypothetical protein
MKICILYTGQVRISEIEKNIKFLIDDKNEYFYLLNTWDDQDVSEFKTIFNESFIKFNERPTDNLVNKISENSNIIYPHHYSTPFYNYTCSLYIKYSSIKFLEEIDIAFDVVVVLRTDTKLWKNISYLYNNLNENSIYTPIGPTWDITSGDILYGKNACSDVIFFGKPESIKKALTQINNVDATKFNGNYIHPETSLCNYFKYLNLNIIRCQFDAFLVPRDGNHELIGYNFIL